MDFSKGVKAAQVIFILLVVSLINSCAPKKQQIQANSTSTSTAATLSAKQAGDSTTQELVSNVAPSGGTGSQTSALGSSSSRMLMPQVNGSLGLEFQDSQIQSPKFSEQKGFNKLVLQTGDTQVQYTVSRLKAPERVVVDVMNKPNRVGRIFETEDSEFVSRVRIGAHPDKSRVVLDLVDSRSVKHDVTQKNGNIIITLAEPEVLQEALALPDAPKVSDASGGSDSTQIKNSMAKPNLSELNNEDEGDETGDEEESDNTQEDMEAKRPDPSFSSPSAELTSADNSASTDLAPRLVGLRLEQVGSSANALVADMTSAGFYTLKKTAPTEYILTLEDAKLESNAMLTLLAPAGTGSIRSVRPVAEGANVVLRIFASGNSQLIARSKGQKIYVGPKDEPQFMAQLAPEEVKAEAGAAKDKPKTDEKPADSEAAASKPAEISPDYDPEIAALVKEDQKYTGKLISLDLQDTDIDNALRIIAEVSNLNIIASDEVTGKVTLRLIDVPWDQALDVILRTNGLDKVQEGNVIRIAPVEKLRAERDAQRAISEAADMAEGLKVRYMRISYAKAAELKPLVEGVITERGSVAYDERTNQLIVKDISRGIVNVAELVKTLDLRTPQVLLETQIVEAQRTLLRDLGMQLGFQYVQSPATGNATGSNFPNSVVINGDVDHSVTGDALSILLGSADGTKTLNTTLTALEQEGNVRIISKPAVATTNNKQALIKSVEKLRVKTPSGGTSVNVGQGAQGSSGSSSATEVIEIGIVLEVTPQASPDYFVLLDINAKSSTLGGTYVDGIPSEIERSATSSVLVSSGQTFAMGGIYKINDSTILDGTPFLKDIPFIGHFFRSTSVDNKDEELLFFLTPRIIEGSFDDAAMKVTS